LKNAGFLTTPKWLVDPLSLMIFGDPGSFLTRIPTFPMGVKPPPCKSHSPSLFLPLHVPGIPSIPTNLIPHLLFSTRLFSPSLCPSCFSPPFFGHSTFVNGSFETHFVQNCCPSCDLPNLHGVVFFFFFFFFVLRVPDPFLLARRFHVFIPSPCSGEF